MPFKSQAQRKYLYKNKPKIARKFEKETKKGTKLPKRVKKRTTKSKSKAQVILAKTEKGEIL